MFAFFFLYQRWLNEHMQILNVTFLRRRRHLHRICVAPNTWIIPHLSESWFDIFITTTLAGRAIAVSNPTCRTIGSIRQNSARSKISPASVG